MRHAVFLVTMLAMAACKDEPSFDERFEDASTEIGQKAQELDRELAKPADSEETQSEADCENGTSAPCS